MTHAAIVENKRLGEVLAFIKSQQDAQPHSIGGAGRAAPFEPEAGLMKDRVDRLAQTANSRPKLDRLSRRCSDQTACAPPAQPPPHSA